MTRQFFPVQVSMALLTLLAIPNAAGAQLTPCGGTATVTLDSIADRTTPSADEAVLTSADCNDNEDVVFRLSGIDTSYSDLYVYTGQMCDLAANRLGTGENSTMCEQILIEEINLPDFQITMSAEKLCDGSQRNVWFIPLNDEGADPPGPYRCLTLKSNTSLPGKVSGLEPSNGEHVAPVSWDAEPGAGNRYHVIWKDAPGGGDGGTACGGDHGFPEADESGLRESQFDAFSHKETGETSYDVPATPSGAAWVAVAADDGANIGPLSEAECVEFIPASSFSELYEARGGSFDGGCSASPGRDHRGSTGALGALLMGLLLLVRRRA